MEKYFGYGIYDLKRGLNIKKHIEKYKSYLSNGKVLIEPIGIHLGLIDELKNQGYNVNEGKKE